MSFVLNDFSTVGSQSRRRDAPQGHSYKTTDAIATVKAAAYFNQIRNHLDAHDFIYVKANEAANRIIFVESARTGLGADSAVIVAGGTGYEVGDIITLVGGIFTVAARLLVTSETANVIDGISILDPGDYSQVPASPVAVTGGTGGDDATFTITFGTGLDVTTSALEMVTA